MTEEERALSGKLFAPNVPELAEKKRLRAQEKESEALPSES